VKVISALWLSLLLMVAGCSSKPEHPFTEDQVTFVADGLTIHGTYRHQHDAAPGPAALLISESGPTDRNGDNTVVGPIGNMRQIAEYLSDHQIASLRFDKVGTGATGIGRYAANPADVGNAVYVAGASAALGFLAEQPGTDKAKISAYGIGQGATHAMAVALSGGPKVHALGLLQPFPGRYLDLITARVRKDGAAGVKAGTKTQQQADEVVAAWDAAVAQARTTGTVPPGTLPDGLSSILNAANVKAVAEQDAVDPLADAAKIPDGTPVLVTCSDSDAQASCADIKPLAQALAHTALTLVELKGVNHVLRDDPTDNVGDYGKPGTLSPQITTALDGFVTK
jgi:pimeloyl-ACP methyl ester carboxylesterase